MTQEPPPWGTPPAEPRLSVRWRGTPAGIAPRAVSADVIERQAGVALIVNLVVLVCAAGLLSAPGAVLAWQARTTAAHDVTRASRLLMWSWLLLASNLLLYLLLALVIIMLAVSVIL